MDRVSPLRATPDAPSIGMGRRAGRARNDTGSAAAQGVLMFPALLVTIMLIFQFALFLHAQAVAEAAAQDAAAAARRADGTVAAGRDAAHATLGSLSPRLLSDRVVDVDRSATTATVSVSGRVASLVPGVKLAVHETASGPVERYVPQPASAQESR